MRNISQSHCLAAGRDIPIISLEYGHKLAHERIAGGIYSFAGGSHLLLPYIHNLRIRLCLHLQQGVTLLKSLVITAESVNITAVILRYYHVHQPAPLLASAINEQRVGRCHHHNRYQPDMVRQTIILFPVALEMLLCSSFHATIHCFRLTIVGKISAFKHKKVTIMTNHLRIDRILRASAKRHIIHRIQDIGLSHTVVPYQTVHFRRQFKGCLTNIPIIYYG